MIIIIITTLSWGRFAALFLTLHTDSNWWSLIEYLGCLWIHLLNNILLNLNYIILHYVFLSPWITFRMLLWRGQFLLSKLTVTNEVCLRFLKWNKLSFYFFYKSLFNLFSLLLTWIVKAIFYYFNALITTNSLKIAFQFLLTKMY